MSKSMNTDQNESGFTLLELLIAITLMTGSTMALHTIYVQLISKKVQLSKAREELIQQSNLYEIKVSIKNSGVMNSPKQSAQK
jgi:prepilin-type N-terminal cleavage/methylation domain-containing protein